MEYLYIPKKMSLNSDEVQKRVTTYCCVPQCSNYEREGLSFHHFPADKKIKQNWEVILQMGKPSSSFMRVCSEHFRDSDYFPGTSKIRRLKKNVLPSQKLPVRKYDKQLTSDQQEKMRARSNRAQRSTVPVSTCHIAELNKVDEIQEESYGEESSEQQACSSLKTVPVVSTSTFMATTISSKNFLKKDAETQTDYRPIHTIINYKSTLYTYTGLHSFELLDGIIECVSVLDKESKTNKKILSLKDRVILTFVKLKLNLSFSAIAPLFEISRTTCSIYFKNMVSLLSAVLQVVIPWPSQEDVRANLPIAFENFKNTRVVVDCAETPVERSTCLKCRILTYSHYKKGHTVKFELGVAPSGLITFISKCYGGRASDKLITLQSHLLNQLDVSDAIMADKGFFIERECLERHLILHQPPFLAQKKQLSRDEALKSAEIAKARVHVERVIQRVREFAFIGTKVAWSLLPYFDDSLIIACAITNLSSPVLNIDKFM